MYLNLTKELKELENIRVTDTNYDWCAWNHPQS